VTLAPRERRFLISGGIVLGAFLAINYLIVPAVSREFQIRHEIEERTHALERYQLIAEGKRRYQKRFANAEQLFTQLQQRLLPAEKVALAAADLQALLHKAAGESGVTITSENIHAPKLVEGFTQVSVELSLNTDLRKLRNFLYKIETSEKLLIVPRLLMNAASPRPGVELRVMVVVSGYTLATVEKG